MLGPITRFAEKTVYGNNFVPKAFDLSHPASRPLTEMGIARAYICSMEDRYLLIRGDNEPLHYDIIFILDGESELETSVGDFVLKPGDFVHMPSNISRRIELVKGDRYREMIFSFMNNNTVDLCKTRDLIVRPATQLPQLIDSVDNYFRELAQNNQHQSRALLDYADLIVVSLMRELSLDNTIDPTWNERFAELKDKILADPKKDWSVESMAREMFVSPPHLFRLTRSFYGQTPKGFLTAIKMKEAQALLSATNYDLEAIASLVGYANSYAFSNAFKRNTGMRPGAFRKKNQPVD